MGFLIPTEPNTTAMETRSIGGLIVLGTFYYQPIMVLFCRTNFKKLQTCLSNQFDKYCYPNQIGCVNGTQTLSENAADLAGLQIAYNAYKQLNKPQRLAKAPMFNSDQVDRLIIE